jgi:hypothetical protein
MKVSIRSVERDGDRVTVRLGHSRAGEEGCELLSPDDDRPQFRLSTADLGLDPSDFPTGSGELVVDREYIDERTDKWVIRFILPKAQAKGGNS